MDTEAELRSIEPVLTEIIGRPSRWSGRVEFTDDPEILGQKPFRCDVVLNGTLLGQEARWRTLIHERLHSYSAGYNSPDYQAYVGWEEGVVEALQRRLRPKVLARLGVTVLEAVFEAEEVQHRYNRYIAALESLRRILNTEPGAFYLGLLAVPVRERPAFLLGPGLPLPPVRRTAYVMTSSRSDAALRKGKH